MARIELKLPSMGESVAEATVTSWLKNIGDTIEADEAVLEVATDKVDTEVPSETDGVLVERFFEVDAVVKVGEVLAIIETQSNNHSIDVEINEVEDVVPVEVVEELSKTIETAKETVEAPVQDFSTTDRFYSPLVRNIAKEEGIDVSELETIEGSGKEGRVTKDDILIYVEERKKLLVDDTAATTTTATNEEEVKSKQVPNDNTKEVERVIPTNVASQQKSQPSVGDEIIELSRMGKMISHHMRESLDTAAHVQSFIEVDVTNVVKWREKMKKEFESREGEKLTFTPIFIEVIAKALKDYPLMNISVQGDKVIKKKNINIGMAAALPDGNLIVPVIKNADQLNLVGMAKMVNDLANRARLNQLKPDEVMDGTYTVTNIGSFGSVFGTPIINQPQVGILALGAIRKMPAVIETVDGDVIAIRHKMYITHSYDHRVVNGALGGLFIKRVAEYLEEWHNNREI